MIKLKGVDETILADLVRVILNSGYRPVIDFTTERNVPVILKRGYSPVIDSATERDVPFSEGLYDVAIITNGDER